MNNQHNHQECHHEHHHEHHQGCEHMHHHGNFKKIFFNSLPLAIAIMVISPMMGIQLPFQFTFEYSDMLAAILSTILLIYGGRPFYEGAKMEFQEKSPGMMALVAMGLSVSYLYSLWAVAAHYFYQVETMNFFFEFASLILIMLLGHWIEMKTMMEAGDAQKSLAALLPKDAEKIQEDGTTVKVPIQKLQVGDRVRVAVGENVPADGIIVRGQTRINESLLTGESKPVKKEEKMTVIGGSTNETSTFEMEIVEMGEKSFISQVQQLIEQAQRQPSRAEYLAQKVASRLFYIALLVAVVAFFSWLIVADLKVAIRYMVTTLVIACPHALGLAIPMVVARSTHLGAHHGLLVKRREALERATKATVMVLDKTGTLTTGDFKVLDIDNFSDHLSQEKLLALMAGLEEGSSHPIAISILNQAKALAIEPASVTSKKVIAGMGVSGKIQGKKYALISEEAYEDKLPSVSPRYKNATRSVLTEEGHAVAIISLGDELKKTSMALIDMLHKQNIRPILSTGDNEQAAQAVADELGIEYYAHQSPEDKYQCIKRLQENGESVIMVGDGINDAPSLTLADVGIAIGAGTQVALDSADVILVQSNPSDIESFMQLAIKTTRKMKENLWWGAGYNFVALPLAAGILAPIGITLTPALGAILMSCSTIIVAINAMLLKLDDF
ncbi:copper-translocating P-type ATPase [Allofustis seminis]|uniref:copper-translocating P-type ATPase n=1 Tax=Allofustis seminis TaxID=166939 RepID=UPI00037BF0D8|nr:copper-translocating P-type ATPase [Allofustis seminis]